MTQTAFSATLRRLRWPLRLTWTGLWAERITHSFWPLWTIAIATLAALSFGLQDHLPIEAAWICLVAVALCALWAVLRGWRSFAAPTRVDALARLDAHLPGQPLAALADAQAIGAGDPASVAVWQAHRARMATRAVKATAIPPNLKLSARDRFGLRYVALTALLVSLMFGSLWRAATVTDLAPGAATAAAGPTWEGWATPPGHTGKPALYLVDVTAPALSLPTGTKVQIRLYGDVGDLTLSETVSAGLTPAPASDAAQEFIVTRNGEIAINGSGGRTWKVTALPDTAPTITPGAEISREKDGRMNLPFAAKDDYGVTAGTATIALDLPAIDRRYGLAARPEPRDPLIFDLPLPIRGNRADFTENLIEDISEHPFANLPVTITLTATDAIDQTGAATPLKVILPGIRFFDPLAAALIEMRRDLLWSRSNAPRAAQILKAITHHPEDLIRNERAYLRLRVALRRLDDNSATLPATMRDEIASELWDIALLIEEGDLESARERLARAQDRLSEAIKNGADKAEIDRLMQELREATDDYLNQLAEESQRNPDEQMSENMDAMEMTGDQIQEMMDELQRLMEEGKTAEAAELMETLRQLMENMQVTQGPGGSGGPQSPGQQAMRDLQETLRDQQDLSDDAFRDLQDGDRGEQGQDGQQPGGQGQQPGGQGQQGQNGTPQNGDGQGADGQGDGGSGTDGRSLSQRQRDLRNRLNGLNGNSLPGRGSEQGDAGRRSLEDAGRAMDDAERALRNGDLSGALDKQAEAMEAMRQGLRNLGEALANEQRQDGENQQGEAFGRADPGSERDPLGREMGEMGRIGSDRNMLQGQDVYRRAQDLLDEIRRRSGEQTRPEGERDYLRRLLDLF